MTRKSEKTPAQRGKKPADQGSSANPSNPRARARTPQQLERQERVFAASVIEGKTVRQIAAEFSIAQETVISDLRHEQARIADERAEQREYDKVVHLALVEDLFRKAVADRTTPGAGAFGAAAKALEMRAKILGLDAPTKIDLGLQQLLDAID